MSDLPPPSAVIDEALSAASLPTVVVVEDDVDVNVRFANNTATTNGTSRSRRVVVASFHRKKGGTAVGVASGSGALSVRGLLERAEGEARNGEPAEDEAPLVEPSAVDEGVEADPAETSLSAFSSLLDELAEAFGEADAAARVLSGFVTHGASSVYLASSTGLRRSHRSANGTFELVARSTDGVRSSWSGVGFEDPKEIDFGSLHARAVERLSWAERRIDLEAGRYEVILPPDAVADLVIELAEAASGRDAEDGGSVFSSAGGTRLGEKVTKEPFDLSCDPYAEGLSTAPFLVTGASGRDVSVFDNGAPLERETLISAGRLERLRYHREGAARAGVAFTPPIDNVILTHARGEGGLTELVEKSERALLLTCLWYIREVDPATLLLTGLTRDGVYLVEHGEVTGAVNNFRFNESPLDLLSKTVRASRSERCLSREWNEWMSRTSMPALCVADFNMSSVSPAN